MNRGSQAGPWLAAAVLVAGSALVWFYWPRAAEAPVPAPPAADAPVAAPAPAPAPPAPEYPVAQVAVPPAEAVGPLAPLESSDGPALEALAALMGGVDPRQYLQGANVVPRLVATIDNLPRKALTPQVYAGREVAGSLQLAEADGRLWLDAGNAARYEAGVRLFESLDSRALVAQYLRFYPLFQQAYGDLGEPGRQFNTRLVEVIDHLLAAPEHAGPIELVRIPDRPRLAFADPRMEAASVGHKALWRLGPDHAGRVKAKLAELRGLLAGQRPAG